MSNSLTINRSSYIGPFFKKKISPTFPLFILEVALDFVWHKWPWQKEQTAAGALKTGRVFAVSSPPPQFVHTRVSPHLVGKMKNGHFSSISSHNVRFLLNLLWVSELYLFPAVPIPPPQSICGTIKPVPPSSTLPKWPGTRGQINQRGSN